MAVTVEEPGKFPFDNQLQACLAVITYAVALLPSVGANRAGMFLHLMPVFGAVLGVLFLGEAVAAYQLAGARLVLAGIAAMNLARLRLSLASDAGVGLPRGRVGRTAPERHRRRSPDYG